MVFRIMTTVAIGKGIRPVLPRQFAYLHARSGGIGQQLPWHGNVRELRNAIEHATVLARSGTIGVDHLPPPMPASLVSDTIQQDALERLIRLQSRVWVTATGAEPTAHRIRPERPIRSVRAGPGRHHPAPEGPGRRPMGHVPAAYVRDAPRARRRRFERSASRPA